jgi:predicted GIY-YIG superfamily endonuclease
MWYVYVLECSNGYHYKGCTQDVQEQLLAHGSGSILATKDCLPVELIFYSAFIDKNKALDFERYLKSAPGRAFLKRHVV